MEQPREPKFYQSEQALPVNLAGRIEINSESLDKAIEKANRLIKHLQKAEQIIDSLSGKGKSEP